MFPAIFPLFRGGSGGGKKWWHFRQRPKLLFCLLRLIGLIREQQLTPDLPLRRGGDIESMRNICKVFFSFFFWGWGRYWWVELFLFQRRNRGKKKETELTSVSTNQYLFCFVGSAVDGSRLFQRKNNEGNITENGVVVERQPPRVVEKTNSCDYSKILFAKQWLL